MKDFWLAVAEDVYPDKKKNFQDLTRLTYTCKRHGQELGPNLFGHLICRPRHLIGMQLHWFKALTSHALHTW